MQNKDLFKTPTAVRLVPIICQLKIQIHQEGPIKRNSALEADMLVIRLWW